MEKSNIQDKYKDILSDFDNFLSEAKDYKQIWELKSYVNESFYEGNHRIVFDTVTKKLVTLPRTSDNEYQIEKVRKVVRGVKNMITKNDPRWHATSSRSMRINQEEKKVASALLQSVYKEEHLKDKTKDLLTHALTKTIAWAYVGFGNDKNDVDIFIEDPFNIYTSPDGRLEGPIFVGKYIIRAVKKSLNDIKYGQLYKNSQFVEDLENIEATSKQAESEYKDAILSQEYKIPVDKNGSCILHELYIMDDPNFKEKAEKGEVENKNGIKEICDSTSSEEDQLQKNKEKRKVRIISKVGNIIIRDELTDYEQFPFIAYQPERNKGLLYSGAWIEPLIKLNKALDDGYSNRADWLEKFAKGRFLVQKGSKFTAIKGRNGQVIEYTGGKPQMLESGNLPQEANIHLSETERYMEDLGGIHSESTGRSSGDKSGVAIAQLQAADNNNVSEPVDNLKTFMEEMAYRILYLGSKFYNLRQLDTEEGERRVIGSEVKQKIEDSLKETGQKIGRDVIQIKPIKNIEVEIIPGSAFSDLQARQDLVELKGLGVAIPDKLILDAYKLGNTELIINEYEAQEAERQAQEDGEEGLEAKQAELENKKLIEGANIVAQQDENHEIHLAVHGQLLEKMGQKPESQLLIQHMQQHQAMYDPNGEKLPKEMQQNNNNNGQ